MQEFGHFLEKKAIYRYYLVVRQLLGAYSRIGV